MFSQLRPMSMVPDCIIIAVTVLIISCHIHEKNIYKTLQETLQVIILSLMFIIICVGFFKIRLFIEELFYINSDYDGNFLSVVKATLNFNKISWIVIAIVSFSFVILIINLKLNIIQIIQLNPVVTLLAIGLSLLLLYSINITECRATKVATIFSSGGLDPGTAMAGNYFYGYLKIILPASGGNERTGILTALEHYESRQNILIPVKKLFILIPSSSYIPPDLKEISDNWMEPLGPLDIIALDRAGVKNRTYHNTIYRIRPKGPNEYAKLIYLATEGATPLKTFLEVQDKSHRYASVYKEYNNEIIRNFYTTLQNLLNDNPDCRDYCELVYYEDYVDGKRINPAHVLLERIARYTEK